ncbi:MAG: hypothetical protein AAF401_12125, partial [Pseudomonadota bacterium]
MIRWLLAALLLAGPVGAVDQAALLAKKPAKWLSAYGLFADGPGQVPAEGVTGYRLATPLFSDYAEKWRFVWTPSPAAWDDAEVFDFPVG